MNNADMHMHTTASDGLHRPSEVVRMAKEAGLDLIAITDHDTVAGVKEAQEEGERIGVRVVPGVEISTADEGCDVHVLGYWMDVENETLLLRLAELRRVRDSRNEEILAKLTQLGMSLTMEEVVASIGRELKQDETVGRPHIASALLQKGYVATIQEAFDRYLASGKPAFVLPQRISPEEAARWIREAGGSAVIAHPGIYGRDAMVERLLETKQFDGLEVFHSDHSPEQEAVYEALALSNGLVLTAGSDFHGARNGALHRSYIGARRTSAETAQKLLSLAEARRKGGHEG
ncbi:PHP domain-containing protein [Paenibacillus turpanensis]|uniref:PHP domain-containing protein n=1 Tax=Paenibacillus turpanensis TaxID=2689078 RepID=UPI001409ABFD|nr:PHP domain-containing protein [Paenibacillus turpanensis]